MSQTTRHFFFLISHLHGPHEDPPSITSPHHLPIPNPPSVPRFEYSFQIYCKSSPKPHRVSPHVSADSSTTSLMLTLFLLVHLQSQSSHRLNPLSLPHHLLRFPLHPQLLHLQIVVLFLHLIWQINNKSYNRCFGR